MGGVAFLGLAALVGARYTWLMLNPSDGAFYRAQFVGPGTKRLVYAHYLALIGPLLAIVGAVALDRVSKPKY